MKLTSLVLLMLAAIATAAPQWSGRPKPGGNRVKPVDSNDQDQSDSFVTSPNDQGGFTQPAEDSSDVPTSGGGGSGSDGYPYDGKCGGLDQWSFNACQCTSFVSFKLNQAGISFRNGYKGARWGNANNWDDAARSVGLTVDNVPAVGAVAHSDAGGWGHVAWVAGVSGSQVQIEEYNFNNRLAYHSRTVDQSEFKYIHFE